MQVALPRLSLDTRRVKKKFFEVKFVSMSKAVFCVHA
jgi:hypothetical protein